MKAFNVVFTDACGTSIFETPIDAEGRSQALEKAIEWYKLNGFDEAKIVSAHVYS